MYISSPIDNGRILGTDATNCNICCNGAIISNRTAVAYCTTHSHCIMLFPCIQAP